MTRFNTALTATIAAFAFTLAGCSKEADEAPAAAAPAAEARSPRRSRRRRRSTHAATS